MFDRGLTIIGISLAILFGILSIKPDSFPKVPSWATYAGLVVGVFLAGLGTGLMAGPQSPINNSTEPQVVDTNLFLQYSDSHSVPVERGQKNIRYWYALYTESISVDTKDINGKSLGGLSVPPQWAIFIIFDKSPIFRQMTATCAGPNNPKCQVQTANSAYAIVSIVGDATNATLEVNIIR